MQKILFKVFSFIALIYLYNTIKQPLVQSEDFKLVSAVQPTLRDSPPSPNPDSGPIGSGCPGDKNPWLVLLSGNICGLGLM